MTNHAVSNRADLREHTKTMSRHGDCRGQIADFRDSFGTINWLYLFFKCGIKTKTHFEWLLWHWSSLGQLNLKPTRPNGLVGCKVPTDLVKISVKEATHMGFYASAFRRRRHYVFGLSVRPSVRLSVRPSVRSLKYPLLTCTWVRWSTRPTVTVLRHVRPSVRPSVCPSVRPERFPGICRRMHGGIGLKFYMLMYLDHLQNWLVYGYGLLIFLILALFWLSETGQILGFRAFPRERMEEMVWNFARRCILTTFRTD